MADRAGTDRRAFHLTLIYGLWGLMGAALGVPAAAYLLFPPRAKEGEDWVEAGDVTQLPANAPQELVFRRNRKDGWKITSEKTSAWVVRQPDGLVTAFAPQCTHLGCAYRWDDQKRNFLCPCHTSTFGLDGKVLGGPAPRPLDRYETRVDGGKILLGGIRKAGEQKG
jgi:menaquinol-cytochrome c reductase iron-sulfur subunit